MRRILIIVFCFCSAFAAAFETITFKSGEIMSGSLVYKNAEQVVLLIASLRFEYKAADVEQISFKSSTDEFEVLLDDTTLLKGAIVEQDAESFTIGTSLGLSQVAVSSIVEIRNPRLIEFKEAAREQIKFKAGIAPFADFILGDLAQYYLGTSLRFYLESNLLTNAWFGIDVSCLAFLPLTTGSSDYLFFFPLFLTMAYEQDFVKTAADKPNFFSSLGWYIKYGIGIAPVLFAEFSEASTTSALTLAMKLEYGFKYALSRKLALGIAGNTNLIIDPREYILMQACGLILEFK